MTDDSPTIETYTGKTIYLLHPDPALVDVVDIAHALSRICRFTGHVEGFYSVGEHALHVEWCVGLLIDDTEPKGVRRMRCHRALHHDDSETYTNDMSAPMKRSMRKLSAAERSVFDEIETRVEHAIAKALRLGAAGDEERFRLKQVDHLVRVAEHRVLRPNSPLNLPGSLHGTEHHVPPSLIERIASPAWRGASMDEIKARFLARARELSEAALLR